MLVTFYVYKNLNKKFHHVHIITIPGPVYYIKLFFYYTHFHCNKTPIFMRL